MANTTLANEHLSLTLDSRGRIVSFKNVATGTELIAHPDAAMNWRMVVPSGRHTVDFVTGDDQPAVRIEQQEDATSQSLVLTYEHIRTPHG